MKTITVLLSLMLLVGTACGQEARIFINGQVPQALPDASNPLASSCNGAWERIHQATWRGNTLSTQLQSPIEQDSVRCLLHALEGMPSLEPFILNAEVETLVDAYGTGGLDFFAAHAKDFSPRVADALWSALTTYGHPDAIARHFARSNPSQPPASYVIAFYEPLLSGKCMKALCTTRLPETQTLLSRNLHTIDTELHAAETAAPRSSAPDDVKRMDAIHDTARQLRARVAQIRRGEISMSNSN